MGRPIFVREDREPEAKYGRPANSDRGGYEGGRGGYGGDRGDRGGRGGYGGPPAGGAGGDGRQLFIGNLPFSVAWQDLKDFFRQAGNVVRADVKETPDRRSKGNGIVVFETADEARRAICKYLISS